MLGSSSATRTTGVASLVIFVTMGECRRLLVAQQGTDWSTSSGRTSTVTGIRCGTGQVQQAAQDQSQRHPPLRVDASRGRANVETSLRSGCEPGDFVLWHLYLHGRIPSDHQGDRRGPSTPGKSATELSKVLNVSHP